MITKYTDRSRILCYDRCPRQRFFEYHCLGRGIRPAKVNLATSVGTMVHSGRTLLLLGEELEGVIAKVLGEYDEAFEDKEIELGENEYQDFVRDEQRALVEAMIRVWYHIQYPRLIEEYEVLMLSIGENPLGKDTPGVEIEINWPLYKDENLDLIFMSRADAILRHKITDGIMVDSFKTAAYNTILTYDEEGEQVDKNKYDDQGISEMIAVENLLGEGSVQSIRMEFFVKGPRKRSVYNNNGVKEQRKQQQSLLVHPWKKDGGILGTEYATRFSWTDEDGKGHKLGKGWERVNIWEEMSIKDWIDYLLSDHYGELEELILTPYPYNRNMEDIENWLDQNRYQEVKIHKRIELLESLDPSLPGPRESEVPTYKRWLNQFFKQNRSSCYQFGNFCSFAKICWEGERAAGDLYEPRIPHHDLELVQITKEKGNVSTQE